MHASEARAVRYAGWAGIVGVVLLAVSFMLANWTDPAETDRTLRSDIADAEGQAYTAFTLLTPALALLLWFATGLRRYLVIRARADRLAAAVVPGMAVFTGMTGAGICLLLAVPLTNSWYDEFRIDPNTFRVLATGGVFAVFAAAVGGAAVVAATSRAAEVAGAVPRWLAWVGYVVAFVTVFTLWTFGVSLLVLGLWLLGAAVGLIRGAGSMTREPEEAVGGEAPAAAAAAASAGAGTGVPTQPTAPGDEAKRAEPRT